MTERRLPVNVDPLKSDLKNEEDRARLARVFEQGLDRIVGYVLPVRRGPDTHAWASGRWFLRSEHLFLIPGDSAIGYRLPLDSLPWAAKDDLERDPRARSVRAPRQAPAVRAAPTRARRPGA